MTYEYLIAGFEELSLGQKTKSTEEQLLELMHEQMTDSDWQLVMLLRRKNDDTSVLAQLENDAIQDLFHATSLSEEDFRTQLLYEQGMCCRNKFVRKWFEFNLNLNNVLAAAICRKHGYDPQKVIIGNNEVAELLRKGSITKNANLLALLPELKDIVSLTEIADLSERERYIDALRWQWLEDATLFNYFDVEAVLAYYLKTTILHRWDNLTKEHGEQVFRTLLADLKKDVKFDNK